MEPTLYSQESHLYWVVNQVQQSLMNINNKHTLWYIVHTRIYKGKSLAQAKWNPPFENPGSGTGSEGMIWTRKDIKSLEESGKHHTCPSLTLQ